jgi:ribosomal protein L37E
MTPAATASTVAPLDGFPSPSVPRPPAIEPVELEIVRRCHFKAKACGACGLPKSNKLHRKKNVEEGLPFCAFKRKVGCATCGMPKAHADHLGAPESFNVMAGRDPNVYRSIIDKWAPVLAELLAASGLPKSLAQVMAEGEVSFGDAADRDAGNYRVMIEKALGDALVRGGYLESDTWARYEFGVLQRRDEPGVSRTRIMLFPRATQNADRSSA